MISVVIPSFNRGDLVGKAIDSVLKQTIKDFEILIVDDFSTDNTLEVVKSYKDNRIKYLKNQRKKGANGARNTGILEARGRYIAFQDSDDEWFEDKLEKQLLFMKENEDIDMCFCAFYLYKDSTRIKFPKIRLNNENISKKIKLGSFISTQTIFCKRAYARAILFDEDIKRLQDWEFCLRFSQTYKIGYLNCPLVKVFYQENSITTSSNLLESANIIIHKHNLMKLAYEYKMEFFKLKLEENKFNSYNWSCYLYYKFLKYFNYRVI